jgi:transcriptional regulator with XRE-family HTH domain
MYYRIRYLREDRDLTQLTLAEYLKMSQTGYSKYETGQNDVPIYVLIRLSEFYNTSVDYLIGITDDPTPYPRSKNNR